MVYHSCHEETLYVCDAVLSICYTALQIGKSSFSQSQALLYKLLICQHHKAALGTVYLMVTIWLSISF